MDDGKIIELYFAREEAAIMATRTKYGKLLNHIAFRILHDSHDAEECVDDTYMKAWDTIPPEHPTYLSAFLSKITRNLSINRYLKNKARTRMFSTEKVFDEIAECIPDTTAPICDDIVLKDAINGFLASLGENARKIFVKRYFYMMSVQEIAIDTGNSVSNVKVSLMRTREKFKAYLEKAGINL